MTMYRPGQSLPREAGPLVRCISELADTPDDASALEPQLATIALLAADRVDAADYVSITALRGDGYVTVAASSDLARSVDEAQYQGGEGPCLDSAATGVPVPVPDLGAVMRWPEFREAALSMGLRASLSIPLFAGSGATVAALNLYGRDEAAMVPLTEAVLTVFAVLPDDDDAEGLALSALDPGGRELITGLAEALAVRATIQRAIGMIIWRENCTVADGYLHLRTLAADADTTLSRAATTLLAQQR